VPASSGALTGTGSTVTPGGQITVSGTGYRPGSTIDLYVYSTPIQVGTATADANGAFTAVVTLPAGLATGTHHLVAAGLDPSGDPRYLVSEVTVAASGSGASTLAYTGSEPLPLLVCAGVLLMAGSALVVLGRRRRIT
jgi:LPXTG-motif cell wall-anchored protein